eukprot:2773682-Prymnesium_polylepis.2
MAARKVTAEVGCRPSCKPAETWCFRAPVFAAEAQSCDTSVCLEVWTTRIGPSQTKSIPAPTRRPQFPRPRTANSSHPDRTGYCVTTPGACRPSSSYPCCTLPTAFHRPGTPARSEANAPPHTRWMLSPGTKIELSRESGRRSCRLSTCSRRCRLQIRTARR